MMSILTKLRNSRLGIWVLAGGAITILAQLAMINNEVWGGHSCHLVRPKLI